MRGPSTGSLLVDGFATVRVARLAREDTLTQPLRDRLMLGLVSPHAPVRRAAGVADQVLGCPWCLTVWSALAVAGLRRVGLGRVVAALAAAELAGRSLVADAAIAER